MVDEGSRGKFQRIGYIVWEPSVRSRGDQLTTVPSGSLEVVYSVPVSSLREFGHP